MRHRLSADIIRHPVRLYAGYVLSYRDVEKMLAERGLDVNSKWIVHTDRPFGLVVLAATNTNRYPG